MDFVADQLVGLFGVHFYSTLTSPTNWSNCLSLYRQLSWGLRLSIHLLAYYILQTLHVMCDIKVFHAVQIRVLILGGTLGALISISITAI